MAASDYMGGIRGPNPVDYAAPLVGFQIGDRLAGLPDIYQKAQERNAFPNGLRNPDGSPMNYMDIMNRGAQVSGTGAMNYISPLLQMQMYTQAGQGLSNALGANAGDNGSAGTPSASAPSAVAQPRLSSAGTDNKGTDNLASLASTVFGEKEVGGLIQSVAAKLGVHPGDELSPDQAQSALAIFKRARGITPSGSAPVQTASAGEAGGNAGVMGGYGAPAVPAGGVSGSPGPSAGSAGPSSAPLMSGAPARQGPQPGQPGTMAAEPAAGGGVRMTQAQPQQGQPPSALAQLAPPGVDPVAWAQQKIRSLDARMGRAEEIGAAASGLKPKMSDVALAQQKRFLEERTALQKALIDAGAPTPEQKNVASGAAQATETIKADTARYAKLDTGIQAMANTSVEMLPTLQAADSLLNAGAATGWAADKIQTAKQIMARIGGDPNGAMTLEAFGKQMSAFINQQTNNLKADSIEMGGSSMRLFQAQITNMQKASPSPDYTPSGNRYLIEVYRRGIDRATFLADKANEYKNAHDGRLDGNFEVWMRHWQTDHPMFSKDEVKNPKLVAPPTLQTPADAAKHGVQPGDPVRLPDGKIKYYHGPQQPQQPQQPQVL